MSHSFGPIQHSHTYGTWHDLANLFPLIDGQALEDLKADIAANGVLEPITVLDGKILDGRNRHFAAGFVHVPCPWREYTGTDPLGFVISQNLKRRHLTESQRAMVAGKLAKMPRGNPVLQADPNSGIPPIGLTQAQAAQTLNVSVDSVKVARAVERDAAPEITAAVEAGHVSLNAAAEVAKLPLAEQVAIAEQGPEAVKQAAKAVRNKRASIGTESHPMEERGDDLYETGPEALAVLFEVEQFSNTVWEPACGPGNIVKALRKRAYQVVASDLRDYGCEGQTIGDFLTIDNLAPGADIVTNPPYGIANEFAARAVLEFNAPKVALLLRLNFLAGCSEERKALLEGARRLARVHVLSRRLPMMHRKGWEGNKSTSTMDMAWFIWDRAHVGPTIVNRWDWQDFITPDLVASQS